MSNIIIAIVLVLVAAVLVFWFVKYKRSSSESRMQQMMQQAGLDPALIKQGDTQSIIAEIRRQCRKCESEALCERWLAGQEEGPNVFCPNARIFEEIKRTSQT